MDTVSQLALGAAIGEITAGKKLGNKALFFGAMGGLIPDLDILITPFFSESVALGIHRGFSHSLVFGFLAAPILAFLLTKFLPNSNATRWDWTKLAFWSIFTHPLLDAFTSYGTQLYQPFSNYPVSWSSIFIIDPIYTLPLLAALFWIFRFSKEQEKRRKIVTIALAFSTAYLFLGLAVKQVVEHRIEEELVSQSKPYQKLFTTPSPLNILLWMGIAEHDDQLWITTYSLLDGEEPLRFRKLEKNTHLIASAINQEPIQRLLWFSRGIYTVTTQNGQLYFNDLRFGRSDFWLSDEGNYIFSFRLVPGKEANTYRDISRKAPAFNISGEAFRALANRILGKRS